MVLYSFSKTSAFLPVILPVTSVQNNNNSDNLNDYYIQDSTDSFALCPGVCMKTGNIDLYHLIGFLR